MKNNWKMIVVPGIFFALLVLLPAIGMAQTFDEPSGDPDAPIDGGIGALVAAGIGYGIKKYRDGKRKTG